MTTKKNLSTFHARVEGEHDIVTTRVFNAPRALVYAVWTDPRHLDKWYGPRGYTATTHAFDLRPGGTWRFTMAGPHGSFASVVRFVEIKAPELLVYEHGDENPEAPPPFHVTVRFEAISAQQTQAHMRMRFVSTKQRDETAQFALEGNDQTMNHCAEYLAVQNAQAAAGELVLARLLRAPVGLVFKAWSEPERLAKWWGPKGFPLHVSKLELRVGGTFLYNMKAPDGSLWWGKFVYREVQPTERLVFVNSFCDAQGTIARHPMSATWPREILNTLTLTELGGDTLLVIRGAPINATPDELKTFESSFPSMREGFAGTFEQLAEFLESER